MTDFLNGGASDAQLSSQTPSTCEIVGSIECGKLFGKNIRLTDKRKIRMSSLKSMLYDAIFLVTCNVILELIHIMYEVLAEMQ